MIFVVHDGAKGFFFREVWKGGVQELGGGAGGVVGGDVREGGYGDGEGGQLGQAPGLQ